MTTTHLTRHFITCPVAEFTVGTPLTGFHVTFRDDDGQEIVVAVAQRLLINGREIDIEILGRISDLFRGRKLIPKDASS